LELINLGAEAVRVGEPTVHDCKAENAILTPEQLTGGVSVMQFENVSDLPPHRREP